MTLSPNMSLDVPIPGTTLGPTYASDVSDALEIIDGHRHTGATTDGLQIPTAGILINADLPFHSNSAQDLRCSAYTDQSAVLAAPGDVSCVYSKGGDLYWNNAAGTPVRVTAGTVVNATGVNTVYEALEVSGDITILPADTNVFLEVDTTADRSITLPPANSVAAGRFYKMRDATGTANVHPITLHRAGSDQIDGATSYVVRSVFGAVEIKSNGAAGWLADSSGNYTLGNLMVGPNAARSGVIGIPNNAEIYARNAANTGDKSLISLDASDVVQVGSGDAITVEGSDVAVSATASIEMVANGSTVVDADGSTLGVGDVAIPTTISGATVGVVGTTVGLSGSNLATVDSDTLVQLTVDGDPFLQATTGPAVSLGGDLTLSGNTFGAFGTTPVAQPTGVAVTAAGIHAALVALGWITA